MRWTGLRYHDGIGVEVRFEEAFNFFNDSLKNLRQMRPLFCFLVAVQPFTFVHAFHNVVQL